VSSSTTPTSTERIDGIVDVAASDLALVERFG